jgi:hypothetical protein
LVSGQERIGLSSLDLAAFGPTKLWFFEYISVSAAMDMYTVNKTQVGSQAAS